MIRVAAASMAALLVYGLNQTRPWTQPAIWNHDSWERFVLVLSLTAMASLAIRRAWFYALALILALTVGIKPVFGLSLLLLGALNLGRLLFRNLDDRLNLLAGFALYVWFFSLTASFPIHTVWLWLALTAIPIAAGRHFTLPLPKPNPWIAMPLVAHFLLVLKPEVSADGLSQHFAIAEWVRTHARFHFDAANQIWAVQPMAGDWALTIANLLGGEHAARMLNYVWLLVLCSFVYRYLRRRLDETPAALFTAMFAAVPIVQLTTTSMFIENFWSAMALGALFAIEQGSIVVAFTLMGAAGASKLLGFTPDLALGVYALWRVRRGQWRTLLPSGAIFLAIAAVPYVRAWWITGNPVFHYANAIFKSPLLRSDENFFDPRFPARLTWHTLFDLTFYTNWFGEVGPGTAGYQWLILVPVGLVALRRAAVIERVALAAALSMTILVFSQQAYWRYVELAMPLITIGCASAVAALVETPATRRVTLGAAVAILALNLYQMPASGWYHRDFCLKPFSWRERERYLERSAPERKLIDELNRIAPAAPVAFFEGDAVAGLLGPGWTTTWHTPAFAAALRDAHTTAEVSKVLDRFGVRYVIARAPFYWRVSPDDPLRRYVETSTTTLAQSGRLQLAKVSP